MNPPRWGVVARTSGRRFADLDGHHRPYGKHAGGRREVFNGHWPGCSKEHDPARRRRRNKQTWTKQYGTMTPFNEDGKA